MPLKPEKIFVQCEYGKYGKFQFEILFVNVNSDISNKDSKLRVHNLLLI